MSADKLDLFEVKYGLIIGQDVWNDLDESGVLDQFRAGEL